MAALRDGARLVRAIGPRCSQFAMSPACSRRWASTSTEPAKATAHFADLEPSSTIGAPGPDAAAIESFNTAKRLEDREQQLPGNRYQYHPPKYNRGPLHPIQSPPSSDPIARDFVPGPFNLPRLKQTYEHTIASDLMTLAYIHKPPGTPDPPIRERLRSWDDSSPYHENRPLRGPRGGANLSLIEKNITWRNIPEIKAITLNAFVPKSVKTPEMLNVARSVIQAISGNCPEVTKIKHNVVQWKIREGDRAGVKTTLYGDQAYEFVDKLVNLVLPKIKDWQGVKGSTGDSSGNLAIGLKPDDMAWFPELGINYDMYPAKLIPGCDIFIQTTAKSDRHARLLLQAFGFPFYGKLRD